MFDTGYPFTKIHSDRKNVVYPVLSQSIYRFVTHKKRTYLVHVEECPFNVYVLKFYDKNHSLSEKKYQILVHDYEASRIIRTNVDILHSVFQENPSSSFGFIGTNSENEQPSNSKRFRIYEQVVANLLGDQFFAHSLNRNYSAYLLLNKNNKEDKLLYQIKELFAKYYPFLEGV